MKISNVQWIERDGYPLLSLKIDGELAEIDAIQRRSLTDAGAVWVGLDNYSAIATNGETVKGAIKDFALFKEYMRFAHATRTGTFEPDTEE